MKDFFKSEAGKREIFRLYDQKLQELNIPYEEEDILTSFGRTSVIQTGDTAHPPLVVIHGSNGCAPVALEAWGPTAIERRFSNGFTSRRVGRGPGSS